MWGEVWGHRGCWRGQGKWLPTAGTGGMGEPLQLWPLHAAGSLWRSPAALRWLERSPARDPLRAQGVTQPGRPLLQPCAARQSHPSAASSALATLWGPPGHCGGKAGPTASPFHTAAARTAERCSGGAPGWRWADNRLPASLAELQTAALEGLEK